MGSKEELLEQFNDIIGITESFQMPEKLMGILLSDKKNEILAQFADLQTDMSFDWFTDYFQEEHSNRNAMMQDFTPKELTQLLPQLSEGYSEVLDVCSGTGGLTIGAWNRNPNAFYVCEELSERAFPLLLFNMAIRNINGLAVRKDILSGEVFSVYRLEQSERFSNIIAAAYPEENIKFSLVLMNPPYSLKFNWESAPEYMSGFGTPPNKAADYAFVLYGLSRLTQNGRLFAILPHGVLFRGQREGEIRKKLLTDGLVRDVVGLPEKLFLNTQIPVCILSISREDKTNVLFVDASREFEKNAKQNRLRSGDVVKMVETINDHKDVEMYSRAVGLSEIEANDYNLNIPRYVDTSKKEPAPVLITILTEMEQIEREIEKTEKDLCKLLEYLTAGDKESAEQLKKLKSHFKKGKEGYEQYTFNL